MPFFNFGIHSSHGCQAHQQIVVINPRATADSAEAGCSLQRVGTHVWGWFVSAGCGCRSSGWLEANYKLQKQSGSPHNDPCWTEHLLLPLPPLLPPPPSVPFSLSGFVLSLSASCYPHLHEGRSLLLVLNSHRNLFFLVPLSLFKHPGIKFQGFCSSCSLESLLHASPLGRAALQL